VCKAFRSITKSEHSRRGCWHARSGIGAESCATPPDENSYVRLLIVIADYTPVHLLDDDQIPVGFASGCRVDPVFFSDPMTAAMKALGMT
jgi:hypothetical protein